MNTKPRVIIADDHPVFRRGLRQVIEEVGRFVVIQEAENGDEALELLEAHRPDILVLDIDMPKKNGLEVARVVQKRQLQVHVIFLTMYKQEYMFNKAMDVGVRGYVLKENAVNDIVNALKTVAEGKYYVSPSISDFLLRRTDGAPSPLPSQKGLAGLTRAERRVLLLVAEHKTTKEIAAELGLSPRTVDRHRENIANKLDLRGPHALIKFAQENKDYL